MQEGNQYLSKPRRRYAKGTKAKHEGKDPQSKVLEHRIKHSKQTRVQSRNIVWKKCKNQSKKVFMLIESHREREKEKRKGEERVTNSHT